MKLQQARATDCVHRDGQVGPAVKNPPGKPCQHIARANLHEDASPSIVHSLYLANKFHRAKQVFRQYGGYCFRIPGVGRSQRIRKDLRLWWSELDG